jgi:hypothetical protein
MRAKPRAPVMVEDLFRRELRPLLNWRGTAMIVSS